jgi:hypothetical protein
VDRFQYLGLMAACLVLTLPLEFVLGARVWRRPMRTVKAIAPAFVFFVVPMCALLTLEAVRAIDARRVARA